MDVLTIGNDEEFTEEELLKDIEEGNCKYAMYFLAKIYEKQEKNDKAIHWYLEAIKQDDDISTVGLAKLYCKLGDSTKAESLLKISIDEFNNDKALIELITMYAGQENYKDAKKYIFMACTKDIPHGFAFLLTMGKKTKEYDEIEQFLITEIGKGSEASLTAFCALKIVYKKQQKYELLNKPFELLANSKTKINKILLYVGCEYADKNNMAKAEKCFMTIIKRGQSNESTYNDSLLHLGLIYMDQQKYIKSIHFLKSAFRAGNKTALFFLGVVYDMEGHTKRAEKYIRLSAETGNHCSMKYLENMYKTPEHYLFAIECTEILSAHD